MRRNARRVQCEPGLSRCNVHCFCQQDAAHVSSYVRNATLRQNLYRLLTPTAKDQVHTGCASIASVSVQVSGRRVEARTALPMRATRHASSVNQSSAELRTFAETNRNSRHGPKIFCAGKQHTELDSTQTCTCSCLALDPPPPQ